MEKDPNSKNVDFMHQRGHWQWQMMGAASAADRDLGRGIFTEPDREGNDFLSLRGFSRYERELERAEAAPTSLQ